MDRTLNQFPIEFVEAIFDGLGDIIFCVKDRQGRYLSVNQAFADRVNVRNKAYMIGRRASDFFPASLAEVYDKQDQIVFSEQQVLQDQLELIRNADGTVGWYLASKYPIALADQQCAGLVGISQDLHTPSDSDLELANLKSIVEFIKQNLQQSLRTEQLAERINWTPVQLDRRMKRVFRLSTKKFIMKCRLEDASRRLVATDEPISEIALACGFSDQSALTRQFRSAVNMTPLSYRKRQLRN